MSCAQLCSTMHTEGSPISCSFLARQLVRMASVERIGKRLLDLEGKV